MHVRAATPADLDTIVTLNLQVQQLHVEAEPARFVTPTRAAVRAWYETTLAAPTWHAAVADVDRQVRGYVLFEDVDRQSTPFTAASRLLYVHQLGVDEAARRRGVGRALLEHVDTVARDVGAAQVALDTWSFNAPAQAFFASCGFEPFIVRLRRQVDIPSEGDAP
jgi:GNAT superfamily N-acetyltransferase